MKKGKYSVRLLAGLLSITAALFGGCGRAEQEDTAPQAEESGQTDNTEQRAAADENRESEGIVFEAQDLDGNTVTESVFAESKLTMVNVWATYCNPCLREMPDLGELAGEYDADAFQIIGIVSDVQEGAELEMTVYAATLVEQTGADYPHLLLNESLFRSMLSDVSAVPTTFFVNEKGEVLDTVVGSLDKDSWKEKIDALLET